LHVPKKRIRRRGRTSGRMEKGLLNEGEESGRERTSGQFEDEREGIRSLGEEGKEALAVGGDFRRCLTVWVFLFWVFIAGVRLNQLGA
jgi:hypothetical protein